MGYQTDASGAYSTAMGWDTSANAIASTAMGYQTTASGDYSTAMGYQTTALGNYSTAMGRDTIASNTISTAMGQYTRASGPGSTTMGFNTTASGSHSTAMGFNTTASGDYSTAMGYNTDASGNYSTAIGNCAYAGGTIQFAVGASSSSSLWVPTATDNSNALVILNNGKVGIGTDAPTAELDVSGNISATGDVISNTSSDIRFKTAIEKIENPLEKLDKINGYTFDWINNGLHPYSGKDTGVIAQEIQSTKLPGITIERPNGYLGVKYERLVALLIECVKSQQIQIDNQQKQIDILMKKN
jgi:hypothetical protein